MDQDPLVKVQKDISPPSGDFWTFPQEVGARPTFTTREVSVVFFGHDKSWFQNLLIGWDPRIEAVNISVPRSPSGYRLFQLHHVELIAHHFFAHGIIDLNGFVNCIVVIRGIARIYRLI